MVDVSFILPWTPPAPSPARRPPRSPPWSSRPAVPLPSIEGCGPAQCTKTRWGRSNQRGTQEVGSRWVIKTSHDESRGSFFHSLLLCPSSPLISRSRQSEWPATAKQQGRPHHNANGERTPPRVKPNHDASGQWRREWPNEDVTGWGARRRAQRGCEQPTKSLNATRGGRWRREQHNTVGATMAWKPRRRYGGPRARAEGRMTRRRTQRRHGRPNDEACGSTTTRTAQPRHGGLDDGVKTQTTNAVGPSTALRAERWTTTWRAQPPYENPDDDTAGQTAMWRAQPRQVGPEDDPTVSSTTTRVAEWQHGRLNDDLVVSMTTWGGQWQ